MPRRQKHSAPRASSKRKKERKKCGEPFTSLLVLKTMARPAGVLRAAASRRALRLRAWVSVRSGRYLSDRSLSRAGPAGEGVVLLLPLSIAGPGGAASSAALPPLVPRCCNAIKNIGRTTRTARRRPTVTLPCPVAALSGYRDKR